MTTPSSLDGHVALVTGANHGIGAATGRDERRVNRMPAFDRVTKNAASSVNRCSRAKSTSPRSIR